VRAFDPFRIDNYEQLATNSYLEAFAKLEAGDPGSPPSRPTSANILKISSQYTP
jgi:hypothetical protein